MEFMEEESTETLKTRIETYLPDHHYAAVQPPKTVKNQQHKKKFRKRGCSLPSCKNVSTTGYHNLPTQPYRRKMWLKALNLKESDLIYKDVRFCKAHFSKLDYFPTYTNGPIKRPSLKRTAVPKLDPYESHKFCIVPECFSKGSSPIYNDERILFHNFPKSNYKLKCRWLKNIDLAEDTIIYKLQSICSRHFNKSDYHPENFLKRTAVPTRNLPGNNVQNLTENGDDNQQFINRKESDKNKVLFVGIVDNYPPTIIPPPFNAVKGKYACSILGCLESFNVNNFTTKLFPLPMCTPNMPPAYQLIERKRRQAWLDSIECDTADGEPVKVCGKHFRLGFPANVLNYCHVDWVPSLLTGKHTDMVKPQIKNINQYKLYYMEDMGEWIFKDFKADITDKYQGYCDNVQIKTEIVSHEENLLDQENITNTKQVGNISALETKEFHQNRNTSRGSHKNNILLDSNNENQNLTLKLEMQMEISNEIENHIENTELSSDDDYFPEKIWGKDTTILYDDDAIFKVMPQSLNETITCLICKKIFDSNTKYFQHKLLSNECIVTQNQCEICDESITDDNLNDLRKHVQNHLILRNYYCNICRRNEYGSIIEQYDHLLFKTGKKQYICATCGETFNQRETLWEHINKMHDGTINDQKNYVDTDKKTIASKQQCDICGILVSNVYSHLERHFQNRKYKCDKCDSSFFTTHYLHTHQQTHNEKAYNCEICNKKFHWLDTLRGHMRKIHPTNDSMKYSCKHCRLKFQYESIRDIHQEQHKTFTCKVCSEIFYNHSKSLAHIRRHNESIKKPVHTKSNRKGNFIIKSQLKSPSSVQTYINNKKSIDLTKTGNNFVLTKLKPNESMDEITKLNDNALVSYNGCVKKLILKPITFTCKKCNKIFKNETNLIQHKIDVHQTKFRCKICGILYENIILHMLEHKPQK